LSIAITPTSSNIIDITIEVIGRLMNTSEIIVY
jgi:hypothetical protein